MKRSPLDIDSKVLAGLIVGALTLALTKLAIPVDTQVEQAINVGAALLAAYLVPSKIPTELTGEGEDDDVYDAPSIGEINALHAELATLTAPARPQIVPAYTNGTGAAAAGPVATLIAPPEVDEAAQYGELNLTGMTDTDVEDEFGTPPLDDTYE